MALNLNKIVGEIKSVTDLPLTILSNSTLLSNPKTSLDLLKIDKVVAKLDAWDQKSLQKINNPHPSVTFTKLIQGILEFKNKYPGIFCLQIMFIKEFDSNVARLVELVQKIHPDEVQINTPLRPCAVSPLNKKELNKIKKLFTGLNVYTVYEKERPDVKIIDLDTTLKRRPKIY